MKDRKTSRSRSMVRSRSYMISKSFVRPPSKNFSKYFSHTVMKSVNRVPRGSSYLEQDSGEETATTLDDVEVHTGGVKLVFFLCPEYKKPYFYIPAIEKRQNLVCTA